MPIGLILSHTDVDLLSLNVAIYSYHSNDTVREQSLRQGEEAKQLFREPKSQARDQVSHPRGEGGKRGEM